MGDRVIDFKSFSIPSSDPLIKHILLSFCKSRRGSTKLSCVSIARPYQSDIQRERVTGMLTVYQEHASDKTADSSRRLTDSRMTTIIFPRERIPIELIHSRDTPTPIAHLFRSFVLGMHVCSIE